MTSDKGKNKGKWSQKNPQCCRLSLLPIASVKFPCPRPFPPDPPHHDLLHMQYLDYKKLSYRIQNISLHQSNETSNYKLLEKGLAFWDSLVDNWIYIYNILHTKQKETKSMSSQLEYVCNKLEIYHKNPQTMHSYKNTHKKSLLLIKTNGIENQLTALKNCFVGVNNGFSSI